MDNLAAGGGQKKVGRTQGRGETQVTWPTRWRRRDVIVAPEPIREKIERRRSRKIKDINRMEEQEKEMLMQLYACKMVDVKVDTDDIKNNKEKGSISFCVISRLHDQANIKQTSSNHQTNVFKVHLHDVCSNCLMFAWRLLDVSSLLARCLLDVCLMFAWSCKRGINC